MGPETAAGVDHEQCNGIQACSLHPGTASETPWPAPTANCPRQRPSPLSLSSLSLGHPPPCPSPQMPAAIFVTHLATPLCPSLLSHCDGTRGGKRGRAAARKVSLPVPPRRGAQRCQPAVFRGSGLNPRANQSRHGAISATRFRPLISCVLPVLPHVFELFECYF